jgi:hypothetical protein
MTTHSIATLAVAARSACPTSSPTSTTVWDVGDPIKHLIGERAAVDDRRLADPDVPLDAVASPVRGGVA